MLLHDKVWITKEKSNKRAQDFSKKLGVSLVTAKLLLNRGIENIDDARIFLDSKLDYLYDSFLLKDMDTAISRINKSIKNAEMVWVYGRDYIGSMASMCIILKYFNSIDLKGHYYIASKDEEENHNITNSIDYIKSMGGELIISCDCCITSDLDIEYAKSLGIDFIIIDRNEYQQSVPTTAPVINPKRKDCNYPNDMLSISGIAFKLIQGLIPKERFKEEGYAYLDLVTIETIAAGVPITGENRILVKNGLDVLKQLKNLGLKTLVQIFNVNDSMTMEDIQHMIFSHINPREKIDNLSLWIELLLCENYNEAINISRELYNNITTSYEYGNRLLNLETVRGNLQAPSNEVMKYIEKTPSLEIDLDIGITDIGFNLAEELKKLAPFGPGNPRPLFSCKKIIVDRINILNKDSQHVELLVHGENRVFDCIGLNVGKGNMNLSRGESIDLAFNLELNNFKGIETIQLNIKDIRRRYEDFYSDSKIIYNYYLSFTKALTQVDYTSSKYTSQNIIDLRSNKNRAKYVAENLDLNSSNLILVNTVEGLIDLSLFLSDIERYDILYSVSFNTPSSNNKDIIVVNPILSKFDFSDYQQIYIYDIPIVKEYVELLLTSDRNIHILYDKRDREAMESFLIKVVPTRDDLARLYKYLRKFSNWEDIDYRDFTRNIENMNLSKLEISLDILSDAGLLNYSRNNDKVNIKLLQPPEEKIDITDSKTYKNINLLKDKFKNYAENAFSVEFK